MRLYTLVDRGLLFLSPADFAPSPPHNPPSLRPSPVSQSPPRSSDLFLVTLEQTEELVQYQYVNQEPSPNLRRAARSAGAKTQQMADAEPANNFAVRARLRDYVCLAAQCARCAAPRTNRQFTVCAGCLSPAVRFLRAFSASTRPRSRALPTCRHFVFIRRYGSAIVSPLTAHSLVVPVREGRRE